MTISLKYEEKYQEQDKLICMVMTAIEGRLVVSKHIVDLKFLSLHQKVGSKLLDPSSIYFIHYRPQSQCASNFRRIQVLFNECLAQRHLQRPRLTFSLGCISVKI